MVGHYCVHVRDREPSRIPVKRITGILNKSRKIRCLLRSYIQRQVPQSSRMHSYISNNNKHYRIMTAHHKNKLKRNYMNWIFGSRRYDKSLKCKVKLARNNFNPVCLIKGMVYDFHTHTENYKSSVYKNLNHRVNYSNLILSSDIETNPGPIDPTKTIQAPYSQDNVVLFGLNAGTQCVAMSLTSLIFAHRNGISSSMDLVQIMNIGNELYSSLSRLSGQTFLMLTEVPEMVSIFNTTYQLDYSPSYSGTIHDCSMPETFDYCTSLVNAIQSLITQNYTSFILTIGSSTVAIYSTSDGKIKLFDSHARDAVGMPHAQGTCVLLEITSLQDLQCYLERLHSNPNALFEVKGVHR